MRAYRKSTSPATRHSWREIERGKERGKYTVPENGERALDYKAPIEPKDVDASEARTRRELVELLSLRSKIQRSHVCEQHKLKDAPPGLFGNPYRPLMASMIERQIDRPSPIPPDLLVNSGFE